MGHASSEVCRLLRQDLWVSTGSLAECLSRELDLRNNVPPGEPSAPMGHAMRDQRAVFLPPKGRVCRELVDVRPNAVGSSQHLSAAYFEQLTGECRPMAPARMAGAVYRRCQIRGAPHRSTGRCVVGRQPIPHRERHEASSDSLCKLGVAAENRRDFGRPPHASMTTSESGTAWHVRQYPRPAPENR